MGNNTDGSESRPYLGPKAESPDGSESRPYLEPKRRAVPPFQANLRERQFRRGLLGFEA